MVKLLVFSWKLFFLGDIGNVLDILSCYLLGNGYNLGKFEVYFFFYILGLEVIIKKLVVLV